MQRSKPDGHAWLLLLLAATLFYFYGLGRLPLVGPDEPRYAQVAREMFLRRDLLTPTLGGHPWFEKPALLYWMIEAAYAAFGVSEWAARCGAACSGLLTLLLVYWAGKRVEEVGEAEPSGASARRLGLLSMLALATSGGMIVFSRGVSFDIVLTAALTASLSCFFLSEVEENDGRRGWLLAGFYASVGVALLAKGLAGAVLPFGIVAAYMLFGRRRPSRAFLLSLLWGGALALGVAALWYAPVIRLHGWKFIREFFIEHHFARYLSTKYHHPQPFYFYLPITLMLLLPWSAILLAALWRAKSWRWRGPTALDRLRVFALMWLVVPVAFFSLSGSKLPGYVLPAVPGAALLVGDWLAHYLRGEGRARAMRATGALLILCAAGLLVYAVWTKDIPMGCALASGSLVALAGACVTAWANKRRGACVWLIACAVCAVTLLGLSCGADRLARRESMRDLLRASDERGLASAPVYQLHTMERTSEFYAADRVVRDERGEILWLEDVPQVEEAARRHEGATILVIVSLRRLPTLLSDAALQTEVIGDNGHMALTAVRLRR